MKRYKLFVGSFFMHLNNEIKEYAKDLIKFMRSKFEFDRIPKIHFLNNKENAASVLGKTGGYDPEKEEITIYIANRHPKDILRSLAHEMLHHVQKCEGMMDGEDLSDTQDPNYIVHNNYLKQIEADAFERGNICFREWEATKKGEKLMGESKNKEKNLKEVSDWGSPEEILSGVMQALERQVEWPLTEIMDPQEVHALLAPVRQALSQRIGQSETQQQVDEMSKPEVTSKHKKAKHAMKNFQKQYGKKEGERIAYATAMSGKKDENMEKKQEVKINDALKNSHFYVPSDRAAGNLYNKRDEQIYNDLLKKFGIKK